MGFGFAPIHNPQRLNEFIVYIGDMAVDEIPLDAPEDLPAMPRLKKPHVRENETEPKPQVIYMLS